MSVSFPFYGRFMTAGEFGYKRGEQSRSSTKAVLLEYLCEPIKLKCSRRQEFVIGGHTDPQGSRIGFRALLVGFYHEDKNCDMQAVLARDTAIKRFGI